MTTAYLPHDPTPYDEQTGHSYAAAYIALFGFFVLDALIVFQWAAMNHFFGA